jgi:hypothetical protein
MKGKLRRKKEKSNQCSHIFRSGPLLPNWVIGGGVSMGQCPNECFPELVVCLEHATKETLAYLVTQKTKALLQLQELHV